MSPRERLDFINFLIFLRGKLQALSIRLALEDLDPTPVDQSEVKLGDVIRELRVRVMQEWQADAAEVMGEVRRVNDRAQRKVRELEAAVDKAEKAAEIVGLVDDGLAAVLRLVA